MTATTGGGTAGQLRRADPRAAAAAVVAQVAARLADPVRVVEQVSAADNLRGFLALGRPAPWHPVSLSDGYPAVALLFAELGRADPAHLPTAHRYLALAAQEVTAAPPGGLFVGPTALAFAAATAARRPDEYSRVLAALDERIAGWVAPQLRAEWERIDAGRAGTAFAAYDTVSGATGVGRYLLNRAVRNDAVPEATAVGVALTAVLRYLTALTRPVRDGDATLPGWWASHPPDRPRADPDAPGHLNLGLAHGAPGPLALLALAWRAGVRVPGQDDAIGYLAEWLLHHRRAGDAGPSWPDCLTRADLTGPVDHPGDTDHPHPPSGARPGWCYGTAGVARALQLAGLALNQPGWTAIAVDAVRAALARPAASLHVADAGLCHGWAGVLHLTGLIGRDAADPVLIAAADRLAAEVLGHFEPAAPFGFRAAMPPIPEPVDLPGFLEGAAGIALAMHAYATGGPSATGWDAALIVV